MERQSIWVVALAALAACTSTASEPGSNSSGRADMSSDRAVQVARDFVRSRQAVEARICAIEVIREMLGFEDEQTCLGARLATVPEDGDDCAIATLAVLYEDAYPAWFDCQLEVMQEVLWCTGASEEPELCFEIDPNAECGVTPDEVTESIRSCIEEREDGEDVSGDEESPPEQESCGDEVCAPGYSCMSCWGTYQCVPSDAIC